MISRSAVIILSILALSVCAPVFAEDRYIERTIDTDTIPLSGSIRMDLTFPGAEGMAPPEFPAMDGFESTLLRSSNVMSKVQGTLATSLRCTYILKPTKFGDFTIGPHEFTYNDNRYILEKFPVKVSSGLPTGEVKKTGTASAIQSSGSIFAAIKTAKDKVYINEKMPIYVSLYFKEGVKPSNIKYPSFDQHEGFAVGDFSSAIGGRDKYKGVDYQAIAYRTNIYATTAGELKLGPASIECGVITPTKNDPESVQTLNLQSEPKLITALPFPEAGMPPDFSGAVGKFSMKVDAEPKNYVKVGDAITVTMEVSGEGNFDFVSAPSIGPCEDCSTYEPRLKQEASTYKAYEQVIIPLSSALKSIPGITFSFFDPVKGAYETLRQEPIPITVIKTEAAKEAAIVEKPGEEAAKKPEEAIGTNIIYIKDFAGRIRPKGSYLYKDGRFIFFNLIPLVVYFSTLLLYKRHERFSTDIVYARRKLAYKKAREGLAKASSLLNDGKTDEFYSVIFAAVQQYFGDKFNLPSGGITAEIVNTILRPRGFDEKMLNTVSIFFRDCDMARFTPHKRGRNDMLLAYNQAGEIVEGFKTV